jgi:hypothetical protein
MISFFVGVQCVSGFGREISNRISLVGVVPVLVLLMTGEEV